jgi:hypothetical protein
VVEHKVHFNHYLEGIQIMKKSIEKNEQNTPETKPDSLAAQWQEDAAKHASDAPDAMHPDVLEVALKAGVTPDDIKIFGK